MANYDLTYEGSEVQKILDTGDELQTAGYIFRGEANPSTVPGTPTERVAYIGGPGTYTNFGTTTVVPSGSIGVFKYTGSAWSNEVIACTVPVSTSVEDNDTTVPTGKAVKAAVDAVSGEVSDEATAREEAVAGEKTAREDADTALQNAINSEGTTRSEADTALQNAITAINNNIGNGYVFAGVAIPSTSPVTGKVFYLAVQAGTYTNFEDSEETPLAVTVGINILKNTGTGWVLNQVIAIDSEPTQGSANLVKSGGVLNSIIQNGPAFDLSAYNAQGGVLATYADLNAALTALDALPADFKKGGMSFKFVLTSDNKYVRYNYLLEDATTNSKFTNVANWEKYNDIITSNQQYSDLDISDEQGNVLARFQNGGIKTKNFDSSKDASEEERGLMSSNDKTKLNSIEEGAEVNDVETDSTESSDLDISDEQENVLVSFSNGHIKTKNFDSSKDATEQERGLMSSNDKTKLNNIEAGAEVNNIDVYNSKSDLEFADENSNVLVEFKNGGIKTKNFSKGYLLGLSLIQPNKIYTTCDDTVPDSISNYWPKVTNIYLEHLIKLDAKYECAFSNGKVYLPITGRRMWLPEPSLGHYDTPWMNNFFENIHIEQVSEIIKGSYKDTPFTFSHICSKASLSKNKIIPVLQIGDSVTEGTGSYNNMEFSDGPKQSWTWLKYYFEFDNSKDNGNRKIFTVGQRTKSSFVFNNNTFDNYAEGRSGWNTANYLKTKTFSEGNGFYDPNKVYQDSDLSSYGVKFSLAKWLERYRTMDDSGNRLTGSAGQTVTGSDGNTYIIGTEVSDTSAYDVCTPKVVVIQLGFNDGAGYVSDISLMIKAIKEEYPNIVVCVSFIDAAGAYFPEKWDGWESQEKDISFLQPIDYTTGRGYCKRLHDKMFGLYDDILELEDTEDNVYVISNNAVQPSAFSVSCVVSKEPGLFGKPTYHPLHTSAYAYHPNNNAHACWGYQLYSFINYISNNF